MMRRKITDEDHREAIRRLLAGMAAGQDAPKNDTFPGEVYMRLASEVLADTTAAGGRVEYEGLRERHLDEVGFRGKENRKLQYAVLCSGAVAGGLELDLLDEVVWWGTDDFWRYGLLAAVAIIRAGAEVRGTTASQGRRKAGRPSRRLAARSAHERVTGRQQPPHVSARRCGSAGVDIA